MNRTLIRVAVVVVTALALSSLPLATAGAETTPPAGNDTGPTQPSAGSGVGREASNTPSAGRTPSLDGGALTKELVDYQVPGSCSIGKIPPGLKASIEQTLARGVAPGSNQATADFVMAGVISQRDADFAMTNNVGHNDANRAADGRSNTEFTATLLAGGIDSRRADDLTREYITRKAAISTALAKLASPGREPTITCGGIRDLTDAFGIWIREIEGHLVPHGPLGGACGGLEGTKARPVGGFIPPGYIYTPTNFGSGEPTSPQPDDTIADVKAASPSGSRVVHAGSLSTRWNAAKGREEFLLEAHVGTNIEDQSMTLASITAKVIVINSAGAETWHGVWNNSSDAEQKCYAGSTDRREGYVRMWIPLDSTMASEPGFKVRVEIRSSGGSNGPACEGLIISGPFYNPFTGQWECLTQPFPSFMFWGADEVFVHLGVGATAPGIATINSVGVALDQGFMVDRPATDPGPDDLEPIARNLSASILPAAIHNLPSIPIPPQYHFVVLPPLGGYYVDIDINELFAPNAKINDMDLVPIGTDDEHQLQLSTGPTSLLVKGKVKLYANILVGINVLGTCDFTINATADATLRATVNLNATNSQIAAHINSVSATATVDSVDMDGTIWLLLGIIPIPIDCDVLANTVKNKANDKIKPALENLSSSTTIPTMIENMLNPRLAMTNLTTGPLSNLNLNLPGGGGISLSGGSYAKTCLQLGCNGGDVLMWAGGLDLAADIGVNSTGSTGRFPHSARQSSSATLQADLHRRTRPDGQTFDIGAIISGGTVNQTFRAIADSGGLNLGQTGPGTSALPAVPPIFVSNAPAGYPTAGAIKVYLPSYRVRTDTPALAEVSIDLRLGLTAVVDPVTGQATATVAGNISGKSLRLGTSINWTIDLQGLLQAINEPAYQAAVALQQWIENDLINLLGANLLKPFTVPNLPQLLGQNWVLGSSFIGTTQGGHLGIFVDVNVAPPLPSTTVAANFVGQTQLKATATPMDFPGSGGYTVSWTVRDAFASGAVRYQSPAGGEPGLSKTFNGLFFVSQNGTTMCHHVINATVTAVVTRSGASATGTGSAVFSWYIPGSGGPC